MSTIPSTSYHAAQGPEALLTSAASLRGAQTEAAANLPALPESAARRKGYGLPCAKCKTYYAAGLNTCPVCRSSERVSAVSVVLPEAASVTVDSVPDPQTIEEERERFLREFKPQLYSGEMQIPAAESFCCSSGTNHEGALQPACVCQSCYEQLRTRVDLAEAALLMDTREAASLVYEAVWADSSNPGKTYENAAQALLNELRRRAGLPGVMGHYRTLAD